MVTRVTVHQVHMNSAFPKEPNTGPLNAQEHRYSRPKHAVSLSAAESAKSKNAGSRAIQILKDSRSRKNEQRANDQTASLSKMRLGVPESALRSENGLVSLGKGPNGTLPNMDPKNLASNRSQASVSAASGRSSANISNLASITHSRRPVVSPGLLPATYIVSSLRTNRSAASQAGLQKSNGSPVTLRSNQQRERNEVGETSGSNAVGRSNLHMTTKATSPLCHAVYVKNPQQAGNRNLRGDRQDRETPNAAKAKQGASLARAIMVSNAGSGGFTVSRTTGTPCSGSRSSPQTYREAAIVSSSGSSSSTPNHHHRVRRASDPTSKRALSQNLLHRRPATALGNKVARGAKAGGVQGNLRLVRQVVAGATPTKGGTFVLKDHKSSKAGAALEQYLKQQQRRQVEEPPLFMDGRMDLESMPNSLEDDKIILDLPDP